MTEIKAFAYVKNLFLRFKSYSTPKLLDCKHGLLVIFLYSIISIILTYPLIANFSSSIAGGGGDLFAFVWNQWWVKYSIFELNQNPYFTDYITFPFNTPLILYALTLTNSLIALLLGMFFNPIISFNLLFIFTLVLAALGMYLLADYLFKNRYISFLSGLFFVFNSYVYDKINAGFFNYISIYFIPFFILFLFKLFNEKKYRNSFIAGILLTFSIYNDFHYTVGLLILLFLFILWLLFKDRLLLKSKIKELAILLSIFFILSLPLLILFLQAQNKYSVPSAKLWQISLYTPDIESFFIPPYFNTVFGKYFADYYQNLNFHGSIIYLSFTLIFLALLGIYKIYKKRVVDIKLSNIGSFLLLSIIIFFFLTLGPFLYSGNNIYELDGMKFTIPLPYLFFYFLPFVKGILVPPRFVIFMIFILIIISGYALSEIYYKVKNSKIKLIVTIFIAGIFLFENFSMPINISNAQIPQFYNKLSNDSNNYVILELPFYLSTSFYTLGSIPSSTKLQYYQTVHNKRILNGCVSRVPDSYYEFYSKLTGLDYLINPQNSLDQETINKIKNNAISNFSKLNIKYIIIHPEFYGDKYHEQLRNSIDFLSSIYGQKPKLIDNMLVYQLK